MSNSRAGFWQHLATGLVRGSLMWAVFCGAMLVLVPAETESAASAVAFGHYAGAAAVFAGWCGLCGILAGAADG